MASVGSSASNLNHPLPQHFDSIAEEDEGPKDKNGATGRSSQSLVQFGGLLPDISAA